MEKQNKIFITVVHIRELNLHLGDVLMLKKEPNNSYDAEAISAYKESKKDDNDKSYAYVANSTQTVVRGTFSAGRAYDKFAAEAKAEVTFVYNNTFAICKLNNDGNSPQ